MKKTLVILLALAMVVSMLAAFPFAVSADEDTAVWSGKANIKWYVDALIADPNADEFHLKSAEDLAGFSYLVNAYYDAKDLKTSYNGVWYDTETGEVLGFSASGAEVGFQYDYAKLGFYIPCPEGTPDLNGNTVRNTANNGEYNPEYDEEYENTIDGSANVSGDDFKYKTVYLDVDLVMNEGDASEWGNTAPANVWMPIGGGRVDDSAVTFPAFNGTFEGQGHTISGLYFSDAESARIGLFGTLSNGATVTVEDLVVENCYLSGSSMVAAISGRHSGGVTLYNVHVKNIYAYSTSGNAGGMVGAVHGGSLTFEQCSAINVHVEAKHTVGGMVASLNFQSMLATDCLVTGYVRAYTVDDGEGNLSGGWDVGAVSGRVGDATLSVSRLISVVTVVQEATDCTRKDYTASCGLIYGAVAKNGGSGAPFTSSATLESVYYVADFQANGEIVDFPTAVPLQKSQLVGKAPKANVKGFDFDEVWAYGESGELPYLKNAGHSTSGEDDHGGNTGEDPVDPDAHQFNNDTWVKEKAATCDEAGVKAHYHCPHCGKDFDREGNELTNLAIAALGHNLGNLIPEKAATDSEEGMKAHYECERCQKLFDENKNETTAASLAIPKTAKKGGCGGVIVGVPFVAVVVLGAAFLMRKKENESK
ncbi:MAG: hypothetical protein E7680_04485 [Ruminococcaceae bacterium]|nr:hypothetical protein [Oscillospiraceae bacterium]